MTPHLVEFFGNLGFDGAWIEAEHGPVDYGEIGPYSRACDLWGMTSIVRVSLNLPGVVYRTLDQGAQGIVMPHVDTADDARALVNAARFHPLGARGSASSRQGIGVDDFFEVINDETLVVALLEDMVAIENLDEILKVDNLDVFHVPSRDLGQSMGYLDDTTPKEVLDVIDDAVERIVAAGKVAGVRVNRGNAASFVEKGARFLTTPWEDWATAGGRDYLGSLPKVT